MSTYLKRYAYPKQLFNDPPDSELALAVVIPCSYEPDIITTLDSLNRCTIPCKVEVIIIINEADKASSAVRAANLRTIEQIMQWQNTAASSFKLLFYHLIAPEKHAGVGLARKVGMDEAVRRFEAIQNSKGIICCFDADSTCMTNYLSSIYLHLTNDLDVTGASIYYEHILPDDLHQREGIVQYELHLRYYVNALRYIHYPFAHQTVGSSMVVRCDAYQRIGGMNKRKAGEDFYFLHRLMPSGKYLDINDTVVYPSARKSDRVPFGTGKAMTRWEKEQLSAYQTYNLQSFLDLGVLFATFKLFYGAQNEVVMSLLNAQPESIKAFLATENFTAEVNRMNRQSTNEDTFSKNWFAFFDGFKVLKFIHFARDHYYPNADVVSEAKLLASKMWDIHLAEPSALSYLTHFRAQDRNTSAD